MILTKDFELIKKYVEELGLGEGIFNIIPSRDEKGFIQSVSIKLNREPLFVFYIRGSTNKANFKDFFLSHTTFPCFEEKPITSHISSHSYCEHLKAMDQ